LLPNHDNLHCSLSGCLDDREGRQKVAVNV
jgi:hypothetical protein